MKRLIFLIFLPLVTITSGHALAQFRTESNTVTTRVGNPISGNVAACPIQGGTVTCGSKNVPVNGCGHCGMGYEAYMDNCKYEKYEGINYAMDIGGGDFTPVLLPSVNGKIIEWSFVNETNRKNKGEKDGPQAIQLYSGTDTSTGEKFWIQFHHSAPDSGNPGTHGSGTQGATVCGDGCNMRHIHVEFAKIEPSGKMSWQDAPNYFCR